MPKQVAITPDVRAVLESATIEPRAVILNGDIERPLYLAVDKVFKALGGKWNRGAGCHQFPEGATDRLKEAMAETGVVIDEKRTAEQFFTPPEVAAKVWERADVRGHHHVLEPSAGAGALLAQPMRAGADITVVEQDRALALLLADMLRDFGSNVACTDFMEWEPNPRAPIDRVVMNPPFGRGKDMAHVTRALSFLAPGGRLVAIMSPHWTFAEDAASRAFRDLVAGYDGAWHPLPAGSFKASGTAVATGILTIDKEA